MAKGVNKITLMGNLVREPEVRYTNSKQKVAVFTLAVSDDYKDKSGELVKVTDYINCTAWGNQAGVVEKYLAKGDPTLVFGKLKIEQYEGKDGQKRYAPKVVVESLHLLSYTKKNSDSNGGYDFREDGPFDPTKDADIPY